MGLADTLVALIRPRRRGLFADPQSTACESLVSTLVADGADTKVAREGVQNFIRALESEVNTRRFHSDLLKSAGFDDVASRGTPPPIVLSTPRFPTMPDLRVEFAVPVESNAAEIRRVCEKVLRERLVGELAQGIRDAEQGIVY